MAEIFQAVANGPFVTLSLQATGAISATFSRYTFENQEIRVRGGVGVSLISDAVILYDYEAPQGRPLEYKVDILYPGEAHSILADSLAGMVDYGGDYIMPVGRWEFGMNLFVEYDGISPKNTP